MSGIRNVVRIIMGSHFATINKFVLWGRCHETKVVETSKAEQKKAKKQDDTL